MTYSNGNTIVIPLGCGCLFRGWILHLVLLVITNVTLHVRRGCFAINRRVAHCCPVAIHMRV